MKRSSLIALALVACAVVATVGISRKHENQETAGTSPPNPTGEQRSVSRSGNSINSLQFSGKEAHSADRVNGASKHHESTAAAVKNVPNSAGSTSHAAISRTRSRSNTTSAADHAANPESQENESSKVAMDEAPSPLGVRLAANVRLPAAAMPNDLKLTDVSRKALQDIVDDYYRELSLGVVPQNEVTDPEIKPTQTGQIETSDNGERTMVVTNGPVAEAARKRADQRFRALFGNAAYNRITMNAQMEILMSADAAR